MNDTRGGFFAASVISLQNLDGTFQSGAHAVLCTTPKLPQRFCFFSMNKNGARLFIPESVASFFGI
jgi:hypothetical protein